MYCREILLHSKRIETFPPTRPATALALCREILLHSKRIETCDECICNVYMYTRKVGKYSSILRGLKLTFPHIRCFYISFFNVGKYSSILRGLKQGTKSSGEAALDESREILLHSKRIETSESDGFPFPLRSEGWEILLRSALRVPILSRVAQCVKLCHWRVSPRTCLPDHKHTEALPGF